MTVSREVVFDLLPVYLAGEASDETKRIMEAYIARDPEIAALARGEEAKLPPAPALRPDEEMRSIHRTRSIVRRRSLLLVGTIMFCLMPATAQFGPDGVSWLAKENLPLAGLFAIIGISLGSLYLAEGRRLRNTGL